MISAADREIPEFKPAGVKHAWFLLGRHQYGLVNKRFHDGIKTIPVLWAIKAVHIRDERGFALNGKEAVGDLREFIFSTTSVSHLRRAGWLYCDGSDINLAAYPELYERLSGKLPDYRVVPPKLS